MKLFFVLGLTVLAVHAAPVDEKGPAVDLKKMDFGEDLKPEESKVNEAVNKVEAPQEIKDQMKEGDKDADKKDEKTGESKDDVEKRFLYPGALSGFGLGGFGGGYRGFHGQHGTYANVASIGNYGSYGAHGGGFGGYGGYGGPALGLPIPGTFYG